MTNTYKFGILEFTSKEIDMICNLMKSFTDGYTLPVKRVSLTKNVIRYALNWKLLEERENGRLHFPKFSGFNPVYDLPVECLWRMVQPMLREGESTGYFIVNNKQWESLNIYPQNSRNASDRDLEEKTDILLKLSGYHYIHFQMAGTTWCIYQEGRAA